MMVMMVELEERCVQNEKRIGKIENRITRLEVRIDKKHDEISQMMSTIEKEREDIQNLSISLNKVLSMLHDNDKDTDKNTESIEMLGKKVLAMESTIATLKQTLVIVVPVVAIIVSVLMNYI